MSGCGSSHIALDGVYGFDARGVAKRFRHAAIFGALESLSEGETMRFVNDHDPLPLLAQIEQRYQGQVQATYIQRDHEAIVIDFSIHPLKQEAAAAGEGCGSGGCGCSGQ
ncbi:MULTISPECIES: DUF2249 domain-containing protein [Deefgea]|uniref:DUF2249 domain-containing protein n=2 Tax=Deefgea TaxID=400947 RepID=A0ABX8Z7Y7_9NEIS|nr:MULTISPECIES: DUF2249 domain-containing protein [Deefgea]MBM5572251.1 DUF2249 domain-containing protein [Deefgea chitinilytica]MBM9889486.1 DUF2249 domain-containing protein [Deefgea sp. CFH1-16]QZA78671.1 DUF2249 domain-containing protein [Deefgea tanakiae]